MPRNKEVTVILLSDGMESNRRASPFKAAAALAKTYPKARLYVIGFDVRNPAARKQLQAIARAGRGTYVPAPNGAALATGFVRVIQGVDRYVLFDSKGKEVLRGDSGDEHSLKEGKYEIMFIYRGREVRRHLWINTDRKTRVVVDAGFERRE